jgi:hypothetical protein
MGETSMFIFSLTFDTAQFYSSILLIKWGAFQVLLLWQQANLIGPLLKKSEAMEVPQNRRFYIEVYP